MVDPIDLSFTILKRQRPRYQQTNAFHGGYAAEVGAGRQYHGNELFSQFVHDDGKLGREHTLDDELNQRTGTIGWDSLVNEINANRGHYDQQGLATYNDEQIIQDLLWHLEAYGQALDTALMELNELKMRSGEGPMGMHDWGDMWNEGGSWQAPDLQ